MSWELTYARAGAVLFIGVIATPTLAERMFTDAAEFPRETQALVDATVTLFETVESDDQDPPEPGTLRLAPLPASAPIETASGDISAFETDNGAVRHLTGYRITWYPTETLSGAVDFMGTWANARNLVCGYVTWDMSDPDTPEMTDLVVNYVDVAEIADASRADRETVLLDANCAFGDIDQNYMAMN
jgi:hypothetical protein